VIRVIRWPFARERRQELDPVDVQGNVLRAYGHPVAAYVFVHFRDPAGGRALLRAALGEITHSDAWAEKPDATLNVAFSASGLAALGLPERLLRSFPEAFRQGMAARAAVLGDTGTSAPDQWDPGLGTGDAHAVFSIYGSGAPALDAALARLRGWCAQHRTDEVAVHVADRLPDRKEHFGYADGMGQPALEGSGDPVRGAGDLGAFGQWRGLPRGEIICGFIDDDGDPSPAPGGTLGHGSTFMVWRKLHEDVATFRTWTAQQAAQHGLEPELLKAKLAGRWPDGSPLALTPHTPDPELGLDPTKVNDFDYADDPDGMRCPIGSHIRRMNPRTSLGFGDALSSRQRIVRRGITYGPPLPDGVTTDDGADRGIYFIAFMADLERQFEFIQSNWANTGDGVNAGSDRDVFIGRAPGDHKFTIPGVTPTFLHPLPDLVTTKGGEYLWVPSLRALRAIGEASFERPPSSFRNPRPATIREVGQWLVGIGVGLAVAPLAFALAFLRGKAPVHATGVGYHATLRIHTPDDELLDGTVLQRPGTYASVVRLSRGFGRPFSKPDVHGVAVRICDAGGAGRHQDLLLATAKAGGNGHEATNRSLRYEARVTSTLRVAIPGAPLVVGAQSEQPMPDDAVVHAGGATGTEFTLWVQFVDGLRRDVGSITLGDPLDAEELAELHFTIGNDDGGIRPYGVLNDARVLVYRASWAGRSLRHR
jgi:Dyp-type peroxidase family